MASITTILETDRVSDSRAVINANFASLNAALGSVGPGTINQIAYFDSTTTVTSLSTATYPSLTELTYVKGVTSAIQTQINTKAPLTSPTFITSITGSYLTASELLITDGSKNIVSAPVATYPSLTELTYVKGVTSAIQTQINTKAPSTSPTFATSITGSYLTASELLITDGSKNIVSAPVATYPSLTELTYVKGVTSAIQTQLTGKASLALDNLASVAINAALVLATSDAFALGSATKMWSDLFLASGAVINFNNGNAAITHSAGIITVSTGDLRVTTAGTNTASVVTVGGTQTLTSKSLTSPTITTSTFSGANVLAESASIQLDPALSADGTYTGITRTGTAGSALAFGDLVYLDPTDSRWELCDANAVSAADGDARGIIGICVQAAAGDGSATTILLYGTVRADAAFPAMTINAQMYVSETAGDITGTRPATTDAVIRVVGVAITADELFFCPSPDFITST